MYTNIEGQNLEFELELQQSVVRVSLTREKVPLRLGFVGSEITHRPRPSCREAVHWNRAKTFNPPRPTKKPS